MIYFDMKQGKVVMDRTESGLTDFGKQAVPHDIELAWDKQLAAEGKQPARITNSINYKNDFKGTHPPDQEIGCEPYLYR